MPAIAQCLSHSPVVHLRPLDAPRQSQYEACLANATAAMRAFDPEVVIVFGPDHYNGFFYNLMPPFCVGQAAIGIGDYKTTKGVLNVDSKMGDALHRHLLLNEFDSAVSHDMHIDHGFTQCLEQLFESPPAFVPIFINCVAEPIASCKRVISFGKAIGSYLKSTGKRVAFIGSGGLSHDAPLPGLASLEGAARRKLIDWKLLNDSERAERESRTLAAADSFSLGDSPLAKLNPAWDQTVMKLIAERDWIHLEQMNDQEITQEGGRSAHEIRTWLAAVSALSAFGSHTVEQLEYIQVPEWIVGYGAFRARAVVSSSL